MCVNPIGVAYTRVMSGSNKDSLTEQRGKVMSGFFRKSQAESEIDVVVRNLSPSVRTTLTRVANTLLLPVGSLITG